MAPMSGKKRKVNEGSQGNVKNVHLEDVLADLAGEDQYDINRKVESYTYERYQPTSVLPTDSISRAPLNFRLDPFQAVYLNTRDMYLETEVIVEMQTNISSGLCIIELNIC
jgi:hypothetical protein